ncbi:MAG: hypothetical protein ABEJ95_05935 [Candidatus Nanohalobium sp.]
MKQGFESADRKLQETDSRYSEEEARELAERKVSRNDTLTKISDIAMIGSGLGFIESAVSGSVHGMVVDATADVLSSGVSARFQGARDRSVLEAAEGLEDAYGDMRVDIR